MNTQLQRVPEGIVNNDILEGQWARLKGKVKENWGKLTDDDVDRIEGKEDQLVGLIQQRYGEAKEDAAKAVRKFVDRYSDKVLSKP